MTFLVRVRVPATTANLGSGFDTLGMALSFYNFYDVLEKLSPGKYRMEVYGEGSKGLQDPRENMVIQSYEKAFQIWGEPAPGMAFRAQNAVPLCRGLGSSAGAVVGGVLLANALRESPLPREDLLPFMVSLEGHPDNVVPCCIGGFVVSCWDGSSLRYVRLTSFPGDMKIVVAVPEFHLATSSAREALPREVPLEDAVFNVSRAALFAASWATGKWEHLPWAMEDKLHQQFRAKLFPGGERILREVRDVPGCMGMAISGSGPSMLAFVRGNPQPLAERMCHIFSQSGVRSRFFVLHLDCRGALVEEGSSR
jgi:homoserine kinase